MTLEQLTMSAFNSGVHDRCRQGHSSSSVECQELLGVTGHMVDVRQTEGQFGDGPRGRTTQASALMPFAALAVPTISRACGRLRAIPSAQQQAPKPILCTASPVKIGGGRLVLDLVTKPKHNSRYAETTAL